MSEIDKTLSNEEVHELSDEMLEGIAGGADDNSDTTFEQCPKCHQYRGVKIGTAGKKYRCIDCKITWDK